MLHDYLKVLIEPFLSSPQDLKITMSKDDMGVLFSIDVAKEDMGSLIGKSGENFKAFKTIIRNLSFRQKARVSIKLNEPNGGFNNRGY